METVFQPDHRIGPEAGIVSFLDRNDMAPEDIDLLVLGLNGDMVQDPIYHHLHKNLFPGAGVDCFKHLCGEYFTAGSFGLWIAAMILKSQTIPPVLQLGDQRPEKLNHLLLYNQHHGTNHAVTLLSRI